MKLKRIPALGFSVFITRATIYGRSLFWLLFQLISLSLVFNSMLSFCKEQKCFIWLLTCSIWIMFYFCLPEILPILALITQRRRDIIFLHDLLVINILFLLVFFFQLNFSTGSRFKIRSRFKILFLFSGRKLIH